jgi:hypothetical protein
LAPLAAACPFEAAGSGPVVAAGVRVGRGMSSKSLTLTSE